MKTIANLGSLDDAHQLQSILASAGIESLIPDENSASVAPHFFMSATGVRLQVIEDDEEQAVQIISETYSICD